MGHTSDKTTCQIPLKSPRLGRVGAGFLLVFGLLAWPSGVALADPVPVAAGAPAKAGSPQPAYMREDQPLKLRDYEDPSPASPEPWWSQLFGFLFKLAMVIGLVVLALNLYKKVNTGNLRLSLPNTKGRNLVVLESAHLNAQQAIHLVSLGGERLLVVGATPQGLTTLSTIDDPAAVKPFLQGNKGNSSGFNQVFDLESVVQEADSDLFSETMREVRGHTFGPGKREWPQS